MTRIKDTFLKLKKSNKKALVSYLVAGDPDLETSLRIMHLMIKEGVDLIELGVPFSDPMAEGVSIQKGYERALVNGVSLEDSLSLIKKFRKKDKKTPIILMGYMNPFDSMGSKVFCRKASKSGLDGILIVDMPPEESIEFTKETKKLGIDIIRLVAPTTSSSRIKKICKEASGFVYYISLKGITGANLINSKEVRKKISKLQNLTKLPVVIGFGIRDGIAASSVIDLADGIVVGSAFVDIMGGQKSKIDKEISIKIRDLSQAINKS